MAGKCKDLSGETKEIIQEQKKTIFISSKF